MNELWRFIIYYYDTSQIKFVSMTIWYSLACKSVIIEFETDFRTLLPAINQLRGRTELIQSPWAYRPAGFWSALSIPSADLCQAAMTSNQVSNPFKKLCQSVETGLGDEWQYYDDFFGCSCSPICPGWLWNITGWRFLTYPTYDAWVCQKSSARAIS